MNKTDLCGAWEMIRDDGRRFSSAVPGSVLQTLLENGEIRDPFDGLNETEACAETRREYTFTRFFPVTAETLRTLHADLVFDGLDTLAEIRVNGQPAARTDNMHRTWRIPVKDLLRKGKNTLEVRFFPALKAAEESAKEHPEVTYTGGSELAGSWALRKAHYMFGWDWGPCLPDAGIWRGVRLEAYENRLEDVRIHQEHTDGRVRIHVTTDTGAERTEITLLDPEGKPAANAETPSGGTAVLTAETPRLWWPAGLGEQPLYTLRVRAVTDGKTEDEQTFRLGLRTLTVSRKKDAWGESFALCCNGVDFFAMGADYIPEDNLTGRMNRERTERLLKDCREANFNTVRVWGGGFYPSDDFFDLCDELGLAVWQDLMFACNTYQLSDAFRESITREAEDNLRRIRHHACLALVCGNNEMESAWVDWGGVKDQEESLKQDYLEQFETLLKGICEREAPDIFYWPSSPSSGGGFDNPNDLNRGDVHDWSVWHGRRPFSDFTKRYPRFCSEFGFESFPCMDTLRTFVHEERETNPFSRVMESHQKCHGGNATILYYLSQTLRYPFSMEQLAHASQWLQAEAVRAGVEHWRRNRGRCMGAIFWQLNDCWPVASWASVDSMGRWKALQYAAKRFFAPTAVSLQQEENGWGVYVSNERQESFRGNTVCRIRDTRGQVRQELTLDACCPAMSAVRIGEIRPENREDPAVIQTLLLDGDGNAVSETETLTVLPKYFPFREPKIRISCEGKTITLEADTFCTGVELQAGSARFSDNWITLYPGEARTLTADREVNANRLRILWLE